MSTPAHKPLTRQMVHERFGGGARRIPAFTVGRNFLRPDRTFAGFRPIFAACGNPGGSGPMRGSD